MGSSPREIALQCLLSCERQGAWSDGYLRAAMGKAGLDRRDAGLCAQLAFGVLQNRMLLDWHLSRLSSTPLEKMEPAVRNCLRLGVYQLLCLDRVPVHAAVNESVALTKKHSRNPRASALVNAVLRAFEREGSPHPQPTELSVRYSHPEWLVKEFASTLPLGELEELLAADNAQPPTCIQVNTCKTTTVELLRALKEEGIEAEPHPWLENCLLLHATGDMTRSKTFQNGEFYVQDPAAKLAVMAAAPTEGMAILDACAAPGGKSFAVAIATNCKANILSCDIHPHKQTLIEKSAQRLGLDCIEAATMNAKEFAPELENRFDLVIADVPCSGLGIIRKKPDIRYKDPQPLTGLPKIQWDILENVSRYVKPGGALLYATCTLLRRENEDVVEAFLSAHPQFSLEPFTLPEPIGTTEGMLTLWPHRHGTDGFFFAKLRKSL